MQVISLIASGQAKKPRSMLAATRRGKGIPMANRTEPAAADLGCNLGDVSGSDSVRSALGWDEGRLSSLARTIEREIIPRLVLAHRSPTASLPTLADTLGRAPSAQDVVDFTQDVLKQGAEEIGAFIDRVRAQGVSLENVFLMLLAPAARRLGDLWTDDQCDFTQVTLGLWRLQCVLHDLSPAFESAAGGNSGERRILLATMPGEQHSFGLDMVSEFFRRAEWDVLDGPPASAADLVDLVSQEWFSLVGISMCAERHVDALRALIEELRGASRNPAIGIIVGGVVFNEHPELVKTVGADGTAPDGPSAVVMAQSLLSKQLRRDVN